MSDVEYQAQDFTSDDKDPAGSWDDYLRDKQGTVGLAFRQGFRSAAFAQSLGQLQVVKFSTAPVDYRRTQRHIRADGDEHSYRLLVPLQGHFRFEQGDAREIFYPGKVGFFQWHQPLSMTHDTDISALILTVAQDSVDIAHAANAPLALDETRPLVRSLEAQARLLGEAKGWTAADWSVAYSSAVELLKGVLNPYPDASSARGAIDAERARCLIEEHAKDPKVTPEAIAAMLGIGERTLYKVLKRAGYPPAATMLREVRVNRAHQRIRTALPFDMDKIAFEEGFPSVRSFRQAYRERYGRTPVEMREKLFGHPTGR
ncbi:helix-turn-helix domain-containing protein [Nocardia sp. SYP-A9097]|uniref:helix-turn-helix domain-containing protein n=1 Tax=Nocardia sp. SYP-A9097 TaxID=2663237 RepID=UPI00129BE1C5|nr:helix-turn-helix domain-containing protein [Nocardia sp. SYP-A9097]MRH87334.1 helix-turn-helix domain-containing protein [Nocardia sp. SYP-A9097]